MDTRIRSVAAVVVGLAALIGGVVSTTAPAGAQAEPDVVPIVECSFLDPGTGMYNTVWGYQNVTHGPKNDTVVPVGATNSFDNPGANAGQPTAFKPGRAQSAFVVTHKGPSTWTLTAQAATAPGTPCSTNPVPIASSGIPGIVTLAAVTVMLATVLWWRTRRARRA